MLPARGDTPVGSMHAHRLTSLPSSTPQCAAKLLPTRAIFDSPRKCFRVPRSRSAPECSQESCSTQSGTRVGAYISRKPHRSRANRPALLRNNSRRCLVLYAGQHNTHGGADQVHYYSASCSSASNFRLSNACCILQIVTVTSGAMVLAAIHRVTFSVLAVPFAVSFSLVQHPTTVVTLLLCNAVKQ